MKTRTKLKVAIVSLLCAALLTPAVVSATGSQYTSGSAYTTGITFYTNPRTVTNPSLPGPEVAFNQDWGMAGLFLGTHNCSQGDAGEIWSQDYGVWRPVRQTYAANTTFCVLTYSNNGSGGFGGTIAWD
jgi:hypothetical protein